MLNAIRRFFETNVATAADAPPDARRLEIATAALLVEVMRLDGVEDAERDAVLRAVQASSASRTRTRPSWSSSPKPRRAMRSTTTSSHR